MIETSRLERAELGLAHVGLGEADVRRLRAMMMMALADGSLRGRWSIVEAPRANVVIVGAEALARLASLAPGNRLVAVLAGASDVVPPGTRTLSWPIRVEALLELLKDAERQAISSSVAHGSEHSLIRLAKLLRAKGADAPQEDAWRVTGLCRAPIYVAPARRQFFCTESLRSLSRFDLRNEIALSPMPLTALPAASEQPKPLVMLQWSIGLLTGGLGPLPWLDASTTFRLQRFPEFQIVHHEPAHRRLAAAFSRPVVGIDAAVKLTGLDRQIVCGFVNATELCGYLRTGAQPQAAAPAPLRVASGFRRTLAQTLRRALGLETANG
jgi:hypothetical protein